ncbi:MAG: hypothetical protein O3C60_19465, partial [Planctomycetota bacterium]|nr:hypothetical protein [Planctomycetota bacterium]
MSSEAGLVFAKRIFHFFLAVSEFDFRFGISANFQIPFSLRILTAICNSLAFREVAALSAQSRLSLLVAPQISSWISLADSPFSPLFQPLQKNSW